ncbi:MAG: lysophospholipid acyltransferase family protein [Puniceicoccales bacterium]|jgi:lysophospholipid acyltransferase (LPLAT)-like uncharacterized protein|nr:lysophospholipid acyltransferase family protein [Puniceicoccales bacterium]
MTVKVNWLSPLKRFLAKILTFFIHLWNRTLRVEISDNDLHLLQKYVSVAKICALWHNRLFVASELFRRYFRGNRMYGLISPSRDGAWLTEIYRNMGIEAVRGSTKRAGKMALVEMRELLSKGHAIALTPDGPRGPKYVVKPGIALLAKESGVPILLAGIDVHRGWRFRSWDRFYLPKPFSRLTVTFQVIEPELYPSLTVEQLRTLIQNTLYKINKKNR